MLDRVSPRVVTPAPDAWRFVLRFRDAPVAAAGFDLSGPINTWRGDASRFAAKLGPDEWLLVAPVGEEPKPEGGFFSLVDVSARNLAFLVQGPHAATILCAGVPLDLHPRAFAPGKATRTILAKAEIVLIKLSDELFRVECWRSFAPYVRAYLENAAREFV